MTSHIYGEELNPYSFVSSPSFPSLPSSAFSLLFHILSFSFPWEIIALVNKHIGSIFTQGLSFPLSLDANQDNNYNSSQTIINKKQTRTYTVILPPPQKKVYWYSLGLLCLSSFHHMDKFLFCLFVDNSTHMKSHSTA